MTFSSGLLWSLSFSGLLRGSLSAPCNICKNGDPITHPNRVINIRITGIYPFPVGTCEALDLIIDHVDEETEDCRSVHQISTLCGCPIPEGACQLCPPNTTLSDPQMVLQDNPSILLGQDFVPELTCEVLQSIAFSRRNDSDFCTIWKGGCQCTEDDGTAPGAIDGPTEHFNATRTPAAKCSLCPSGETSPLPYKEVPMSGASGLIATCGVQERAAGLYDANSAECKQIQGMAKACGCPVPQAACSICPGGSIPQPHNEFAFRAELGGSKVPEVRDSNFPQSCETFDSKTSATIRVDDPRCYPLQLRGGVCGCPNAKMTALTWTMRVAAILSMCGSFSIIVSILRSKRNQTRKLYHHLMLGMSTLDLVSSIGYALSTLMLPEAFGYPGARGSVTTCRVQGFLLQLGLGSIFYNLALSIHFALSVNRRISNRRAMYSPLWIHIPALTVAFGLAFGAIPFYGVGLYYCYVVPPLRSKLWAPLIVFFMAPVSICMLGATIATINLWCKVHSMENATAWTRRWSPSNPQRNQEGDTLSSTVFWTSFWYLLGFWATFPFIFLMYSVRPAPDTYWMFLVASMLSPLQGFWNAIVFYYRRRMAKHRRRTEENPSSLLERKASIFANLFTRKRGSGASASVSICDNADAPVGAPGMMVLRAEEAPPPRCIDEDT